MQKSQSFLVFIVRQANMRLYIDQYRHQIFVTQNVAFDPAFVAGSLVCLYNAFLSHVPESKQIEFEKTFKSYLTHMFQNKEQYTLTKFNDHNNQ